MTYGWAILIIAVVLGALFQLGVFNSSSFSPRAPPGACQVFRPSGPGTITNINLMGVCTGQLPQYVAQLNAASSYVAVANPSMSGITTAITISAWMKLSGANVDYNNLILTNAGNAGFSLLLAIRGSDGNVIWYIPGIPYMGFGAFSQLKTGWNHVSVTYDANAGANNVKFYINGALQNQQTNTGTPSATTDIKIGYSANYNFQGSLSNFQIYNTSLSANQIQALYLEGIGGAPMKLQNLMAWWPLNGDTKDYSGNNNNGVPSSITFTSQYGK